MTKIHLPKRSMELQSCAESSSSAERRIRCEAAELKHFKMSRQDDSPQAELCVQSWDIPWRAHPTQLSWCWDCKHTPLAGTAKAGPGLLQVSHLGPSPWGCRCGWVSAQCCPEMMCVVILNSLSLTQSLS